MLSLRGWNLRPPEDLSLQDGRTRFDADSIFGCFRRSRRLFLAGLRERLIEFRATTRRSREVQTIARRQADASPSAA